MIWRRDSPMSIISEDKVYAIARTDDMDRCCFLLFHLKNVIASAWTLSKADRARADAINLLKSKAEEHAHART